MKYLIVKSKGLIDLKSLLVVKSSKAGDVTKIGMFGSGVKYSISVLMRERIDFNLHIGLQKVQIEQREDTMTHDDGSGTIVTVPYKQIYINGQPSSFTADSGPKWKLWMVIRELYSNALDQVEHKMFETEEIENIVEEGYTTWILGINEELQNILNDIHLHFSEYRKDLLWFTGENKVFHSNQQEVVIYRKGIRCSEGFGFGTFSYDLENVGINESRILENRYAVLRSIAQLWSEVTDTNALQKLLSVFKNYGKTSIEYDTFTHYPSHTYNEVWTKFLHDKNVGIVEYSDFYDEEIMLPKSLYAYLKRSGVKINAKIDVDHEYSFVESTDIHLKHKLQKAEEFLKEANFKYSVTPVLVHVKDEDKPLSFMNKDKTTVFICCETADSIKMMVKAIVIAQARSKTHYSTDTHFELADLFINYMEREKLLPL